MAIQRTSAIAALAAIAVLSLSSCSSNSHPQSTETTTLSPQRHTVPLTHVRLLDSPFLKAQRTNRDYILSLNAGQLLAPYRIQAGIPTPVAGYGNWEGDGLGGHIGGHYISALSLLWASSGDAEVGRRLDYFLDELAEVQAAHGNGYIGGVPESDKLWQAIASGNIEADLFILNDSWVPWYNLHKVFKGLLDAYRYADRQQALTMLVKLADWTDRLLADLSDEQVQTMLITEYGGMNTVFADLYDITQEPRYLALAKRFSQKSLLKPLSHQQDKLTGLHANTQIPKVIGFERIAEVSDDRRLALAAKFFWHTVTEERSVAIGGNSVREHFHDSDDFRDMITSVEGPETCNSYNMLELSRLLYQRTGNSDYVDYYERTLYNHILSSQHPQHGGLVYFTPMRPNHYRKYSAVQDAMWCCVGSGIESHSQYGKMIYAEDSNNLYVNLFIPSKLNWQNERLALTMSSDFPDSNQVSITVDDLGQRTLQLRHPAWATTKPITISINGKAYPVSSKPGEYIAIEHNWQPGDTIKLTLPMHLQVEQLPDESPFYAILYGPIVLAAKTQPFANEQLDFVADDSRMGHIASGEQCPLDKTPIFAMDSDQVEEQITRIDSSSLQFSAQGIQMPNGFTGDYTLIPFFRLHDSRYMMYWPVAGEQPVDQFRDQYLTTDPKLKALQAITIDSVSPGEQQPEADHYFAGNNTRAGVNQGRHWRDAPDGWFSYQLNNPDKTAQSLNIQYFAADANRQFDITVNGELLKRVTLPAKADAQGFYRVSYELPASLQNSTKLTVRFEAATGSIAGGIYDVRLLR